MRQQIERIGRIQDLIEKGAPIGNRNAANGGKTKRVDDMTFEELKKELDAYRAGERVMSARFYRIQSRYAMADLAKRIKEGSVYIDEKGILREKIKE